MTSPNVPVRLGWSALANGHGAWLVGTGVAFLFVGTPLAWIVRDLAHGGKSPVFSAALIVLGTVLIANFAAVRRGRLNADRLQTGMIVVPLLMITVLALAASLPLPAVSDGTTRGVLDMGLFAVDMRQIVTNVVLVVFAFAGFSQPVSAYSKTHYATALVGIVACGLSLAYAFSSLDKMADVALFGRFGGFGDENSSPGTMASVAALTIAAAWIWFRERRPPQLTSTVMMFLAFFCALPILVLTRSRTVMFGFVLAAMGALVFSMIHSRFRPRVKKRRRRGVTRNELVIWSTIAAVAAGTFAVAALHLGPYIERAWAFFNQGFYSLLSGGGMEKDPSAATRYAFYAKSLDTLDLMGSGYKVVFVDNPVWGAFCDLGLIGGAAFFIVAVLIPLKICLDLGLRRSRPPFVNFSIAAYLIALPNLFLSNTPYVVTHWQGIILFYVIAARYWATAADGSAVPRKPVAMLS